jgi:hypothetical protein
MEMLDRMQTGRWKVFSTCGGWFGEFRLYHRKDGLIVKLKDDLISSSRYAYMMRRFAIKVRPAEDGDQKVAEVRQGLIRFIENRSNAQQVYALAGEDQVGGGLGHFRIALEYAADDSFDQDITVRHIPDPFAVVWDAQSTDPTGADARFCFVVDEVDRATFEEQYPDSAVADSSLTVPIADHGWVSRDIVRVTEYWVMKPKVRTLALVLRPPATEPAIEDITGKEAEARPFVVTGADGRPKMRQAMRHYACMYLTNGVELLELQPYELPLSRLPIIKVTGREIRVGPRRYRFGLVRWAKDPIRYKNLMRSSAAQWIGQAPKQQWLVQAQDEEEVDNIREAGKSGDSVIAYSGANPPTRLDPPSAPNALLQESALADQDIKDVTGLHDASLGLKSNETSGVAIRARESQGDVGTFMYHDNLHASIREGGRVMNELIPVTFDTARTIVVLGEDGVSTPTRINDPNADEHIAIGTGKYDIALEVGPSYSTRRAEAAESMAQFFQAVPMAGQIAGDLYAKAQDWPMAEMIADRMKKTLPPGLAEDEEGAQPDPRQAAAAQAHQLQLQAAQQAQEAAAQAAHLDLALKAAQVRKAEADADAAMFNAMKARAELNQPMDDPADPRLHEALVAKAEADATRAHLAAHADFMDLADKPIQRAHLRADLAGKLAPQAMPSEQPVTG